ncbi:hypothetical protein LBMAG56_28060 [Verrucomicrobiota bacterium]|nr:hypothetical protein LBMAG56_28060 [Verrucomicrobiota bacterium]
MNKPFLALLFAGVGVVGWLLFSAWQKAVPVVPPPPPPPTQVQAPATPNLAVTNIPGIGAVPTDPQEIEKFKAKSKRELLTALRGVGVFSNRQDQIRAQDSGEMAWIFIEQRKSLSMALGHIHEDAVEPYSPRTLEALEHILKHGTDPQMKLTAATLLYRYDQPSGKEYLLAVLNSPTTDLLTRHVVLTLARNREVEAITGIVAAFPKLGSPSSQLFIALGVWNDPALNAMLRQQYQLTPKNWDYALALAQGGSQDAIKQLTEVLATKRSLGYLSFTVEGTLVREHALEPNTWEAHMREFFKKSPRDGVSTMLPAFAAAGPQVGAKCLQEMLASTIPLHEEYLAGMELQAKRVREKDPLAFQWFPKDTPTDFMKGAAQLLGQWGVKEAVPTLEQVLVTTQKDNRVNVFLNEALGLALYRLDPAHWRDTLLNAGVPTYHVDRIPPLAKLRPIPSEYLPKQVNLKAR